MNSVTSEYLTTEINKLSNGFGLDINMICHFLEYAKEYAMNCLTAEDVTDKACDTFSRLYDIYHSTHLYITKHSKPSYNLSSIYAFPVTIDFGSGYAHMGIFYHGRVKAKIATGTIYAHKFTFLYGTGRTTFYVIEGLYPWIFIPVKRTSGKQTMRLYIENANRTLVVLKPSNTTLMQASKHQLVAAMARFFDTIALAVEEMQKYGTLEDSCLKTCIGSPVDLRIDTQYPDTHKSPVEHMRKAHLRTYKNGKQVLVHETVVCAHN